MSRVNIAGTATSVANWVFEQADVGARMQDAMRGVESVRPGASRWISLVGTFVIAATFCFLSYYGDFKSTAMAGTWVAITLGAAEPWGAAFSMLLTLFPVASELVGSMIGSVFKLARGTMLAFWAIDGATDFPTISFFVDEMLRVVMGWASASGGASSILVFVFGWVLKFAGVVSLSILVETLAIAWIASFFVAAKLCVTEEIPRIKKAMKDRKRRRAVPGGGAW